MSTGYTRQSAGVIVTSNTIQASHFNNEFNLLESFADATVGHTHDGTTGGGAAITPAGLSGLSSNGMIARTSATTFASRTITGTSNRLTVTNGDGVSGNPTLDISAAYVGQSSITTLGTITTGVWTGTAVAVLNGGTGATTAANARTNLGVAIGSDVQAYDATLAALAIYNTNGLITQTAADTFTGRTVTGTASRISITNGSGVSGNPTIDIDAAYVGQTSIITLGTIATGTWQGSILVGQYGGTGVANTGKTITLGGNLTTSGAFATTVTVTGITTITLPTSGTLATLLGSETLVNKTLTSPILNSIDSSSTATTQALTDSTTKLATTAFVQGVVANGAWTSYTPTVSAATGSITSYTVTGAYAQIGKTVNWRAQITLTNAGTGSGNMLVSLPVTPLTTSGQQSSGKEISSTGKAVTGALSGSNMAYRFYDATTNIVTGYVVVVGGSYEAA